MRKGTKFKRFLSTLVCLSMICSLVTVPYSVSAATSATAGGRTESNGVTMDWDKFVRDNGDGTYTLSFSAKTAISHTASNIDIRAAKNGFYEVPADGKYIVQAWGSKGGKGSDVNYAGISGGDNFKQGGIGGEGGYVEGILDLKAGQKIAYTIGSNGRMTSSSTSGGGANGTGGNHGESGSYGIGGGGGYTAVFVYDAGKDITYNHSDNYVLIAGGGGGGGAGHSSQSQAPDGGSAGNINTSLSAELTADQNNGVAGTYYAGSDGTSNSDDDGYIGHGATNLPGAANSTIWGWMSSTAGNDWLATYNTSQSGGRGGNGNGRGGAGGAGFAGGGGGIQNNIISARDCGGGGGGSSFVASTVKAVDASYRSYMATENTSNTGGSVVIIPIIDNVENISTLNNVTISGTVSDYFDIVSQGTEAVSEGASDKTFTFENVNIQPTMTTESAVATISVTVKPREGFAGGNSVPLLKDLKASNANYSFVIGEKADTDFVNVPWTHKITANTIHAETGATLNTADLYVDDNGRESIGTDNYAFIEEISAYSVEGISGETFTAPEETTTYTVSYTVKAKKAAAKVGTPVVEKVSATAVVDVSGMIYTETDGANIGYNKTLKYNSDTNTYDLVVESTVSAVEGVGSTVTYTENMDEVAAYTTAGTDSYTIPSDGYYLILLRGADGGQGGDTSVNSVLLNHRHGYGGDGADGGYAYMIGKFETGDKLQLQVGSIGEDAEDVTKSSSLGALFSSIDAKADAGKAGGHTFVTYNGDCLAVAGGGAGGGGSFARQIREGTDIRAHGFAAKQSEGFEVRDDAFEASESFTTAATDGSQTTDTRGDKGGNEQSNYKCEPLFEAGESGKSYVSAAWAVEKFSSTDPNYKTLLSSDKFNKLIELEEVAAETSREHYCKTLDDSEPVPLGSFRQAHKELTNLKDTAGIKIYKIERTKNETELEGVRDNLIFSGEISKYFTINSVKVDGAKSNDTPVITNGEGGAASSFSVSGISANGDEKITYTINLSPKEGFLGGNDVLVLNTSGTHSTGLQFSRTTGITDDTTDDIGLLEARNESDFANVAIADHDFNLTTHDKTIVKGESVKVSELHDAVTPLPTDWTADFVKLEAGLDGVEGDEVSPAVTTEYMLSVELAPKASGEKAVVAQKAESVKESKPATVYVEYSVTYSLTNITGSNSENAQYHESYTTILESGGYVMPDNITVKMGTDTLTAGTDYTYDKSNGRVYINEGVIEDNIVITAAATVRAYTLTYNVYDKDGELAETKTEAYGIGASIDHTWATERAAKENENADAGYTFGWVWETEDGKALDTMPGHDVTVNGYYAKNAYTLTIEYVKAEGGTAAETYTGKYIWGESYSVDSPKVEGYLANKPTVSGTMPMAEAKVTVTYTKLEPAKYPLIIYYKYEDGTDAAPSYSASYEENETYSVASPTVKGYKANEAVVSGTMTTAGATVTVTYIEDITAVNVTFDANGGTAAYESKTVYYGNGRTYGSLPQAIKSGATFLGWFTDKDNGTQVTSTTEVTNSAAHTLYAHWQNLTDTVVYDANGGTFTDGVTLTKDAEYNKTYPAAGEDPTRGGYKFLGWYTDKSASTKFDTRSTFGYASPRTLYAGWELVDSAVVNFKNGDYTVKKFTFDPGTTLTAETVIPPTLGGYFKGWDGSSEVLVLEYNAENKFTVTDETDASAVFEKNYLATWYAASTMGKANISNGKAQAVTLKSGKKAIRFLALIDSGYADYSRAGFVITTECPTPTIEAGYQYSSQSKIYEKIYAMTPDGNKGYLNIDYLSENTFSFATGAGLLYTNLIVDEKENVIYHATPYIVTKDGEYVYGQTSSHSYNDLREKDEAVKNNEKTEK